MVGLCKVSGVVEIPRTHKNDMEIKPIAYFRSPFGEKFGVPRQAGLASELRGEIVFEPEYRDENAFRGIADFEYLWLIWGFSAVRDGAGSATVRPPRLGGNEAVGVFASRSPFRPNRLGLSSVRLEGLHKKSGYGTVLSVLGADLMDGTPIYDIKPYLPYTDSHPTAKAGFTDTASWQPLKVIFPEDLQAKFLSIISPVSDSGFRTKDPSGEGLLRALTQTLSLDPRPRYHNDPDRTYGMSFAGLQVSFRVCGECVIVVGIAEGL